MGGFSMKWTKWELSLAVGLAVILTQSAASGDVVVKSKLAELLALLMGGK